MTSSDCFFCQNKSTKHKVHSFIFINDPEKQQVSSSFYFFIWKIWLIVAAPYSRGSSIIVLIIDDLWLSRCSNNNVCVTCLWEDDSAHEVVKGKGLLCNQGLLQQNGRQIQQIRWKDKGRQSVLKRGRGHRGEYTSVGIFGNRWVGRTLTNKLKKMTRMICYIEKLKLRSSKELRGVLQKNNTRD